MASKPISFGTDGWRARIADDYTFAAVRRCALGFARYLEQEQSRDRPVVIGYDKRFGSEAFAAVAAEVMAGAGFQVLLTEEATPTPVISHAIVHRQASGGINITASHNPPGDNGFKVRDHRGGAIAPEGLRAIEAQIPADDASISTVDYDEGLSSGAIELIDPSAAYTEQIANLVDLDRLQGAGIKLMVDAMWGNGADWFPRLLAGGKSTVHEIHNVRNPVFPEMSRPEPIPPNVDAGLAASKAAGADVLIITDGDADRLGVGDENGEFVDQLRSLALLALYFLEVRGERGPIVKTLSTTSMLSKLGKLYDVPVHETGVGFKYVAPKMIETQAMIGGEESGGYAFRGHVPERDGILAGLFLLDMMVRLDRKPTQLIELLFEKVGPHFYQRIDTVLDPEEREAHRSRIEGASPQTVGGLQVTGINRTDGNKFELEDGGWLLIRFSGTEPIMRVYCETTEEARVEPILDDGLRIAGLR